MEFQVEENSYAKIGEMPYGSRAFRRKKLAPDFEEARAALKPPRQCNRGPQAINIQGDD